MRSAFLAAALGSAALIAGAAAQQQPQVTPDVVPQGEVRAKAAIAECDRLINLLQGGGPKNPGISVEQVRAWDQASNTAACRDNLRRIEQATERSAPSSPAPGAAPQ
jgi:hypothetical protein